MSNKLTVRCVELDLEFSSLQEAVEAFGKENPSHLSSCIKGRVKTAYGYHWVAVKPKKPKKKVATKNKPTSLCWDCYRADHFVSHPCPWVSKFEPVEDWTAEEIDRDDSGQTVRSFHVIKCPLFMADDKRSVENE